MRNYIIFLILLVPRMQAQGENITSLIDEIDEYFANLRCPQSLIKPIVVDFNEFEGAPEIELSTRMRTYTRFKLIDTLLSNPDFKQKCSSAGPSRELSVMPRTLGLVMDIWRKKLCDVLNVFESCVPYTTHYVPPPNILLSETCSPFEPITLNSRFRQAKRRLIRCTNGRQETVMPAEEIDDSSPISSPKPEPEYALCTPIDQQKQLSCVFNNKTKIIVPMQIEDKPKVSFTPALTPMGIGVPVNQNNLNVGVNTDGKPKVE
ncbi:uncharacterized protein [Drosophila kikkawai]|uniref:Uncharacterized protein n=1 Tax=Drosophila kikkawai TaxID=30033 RepID=A0A6P4ISQ0_DROKI|nr:uncharacterized protein LOC108076954 [Drosophila kikkawai]